MKLIGERIRVARQSRGITQIELAELVGKSQYTISNYETGRRVMPITEIPLFAEVLDKPVAYFFGDIDPDGELSELYNRLDQEDKQQVIKYVRFLFEQSQVS